MSAGSEQEQCGVATCISDVRRDPLRVGSSRPATSHSAPSLLEEVYDELRMLASTLMNRERPGHTLQPTAVVHETYLRLSEQTGVEWQNKEHFRAVAAMTIRRTLVDHARRTLAAKRGGDWSRVTLSTDIQPLVVAPQDLLALDEALDRLRTLHERQAQIIELRFFGAMSVDETADALGVSPRTIDGDWRLARAWLRREFSTEARS